MNIWTYRLPFAEVLPNGDVMVVYYAGDDCALSVLGAGFP
jgi:hypothetical protein